MSRLYPAINLDLRDWAMLLIMSVPAFYLLGAPAIYIWDEVVYVTASQDMANGASWWLPVHGEYNTKPPLVMWMQALCLKIIPSAEWAVRLPSALAVTGILFLLSAALKRWGFDFWTRVLVMICFVANEGFIRVHISRTGDLDAVMSFFTVAYSLVVLDAIHQRKFTGKHLLLFYTAVVAAFYAKSIGGWLMLGPLLLVWLLSPVRHILFTIRFWIGGIIAIGLCSLYYLTRELLQPGFLNLVWHSEYLRIAKNVMPWHEHGASYYFTNFEILKTYTPWYAALAGAILASLFTIKDQVLRGQMTRWIILGLGFMLVITIPAVKLEWYDAPVYPWFALIIGVAVGQIITKLPGRWKWTLLIPVALLFWRKLNFIQNDILPRHAFEYEGAILRKAEVTKDTKVFMKVQYPEHRLQLDFYTKEVKKEKGITIEVIDNRDSIIPGNRVIISQTQELDTIQYLFLLDTLNVWPGLGYEVLIAGKKE